MSAVDDLVSGLDYPMFIVTTAAGGERAGCLVGFVTQASIDPARLIVCLSKANFTHRVAKRAETLVVHFLSEQDMDLARLFGEETGDDIDKFAHCEWDTGPEGIPVLGAGRGWVAGRILQALDAGDHDAFWVAPFASERRAVDARQLGFQQVRALAPGHPA